MNDLKMSNGTKYVLMRRCLQCYAICEHHNKTCSQCSHLFTREATEQEQQEANDKILKLQEKAKEERLK